MVPQRGYALLSETQKQPWDSPRSAECFREEAARLGQAPDNPFHNCSQPLSSVREFHRVPVCHSERVPQPTDPTSTFSEPQQVWHQDIHS